MRRYRKLLIALIAVALLPLLVLPFTIYADGFRKASGYHAPALASNSMDNSSLLVFTEVDIWGRASIKGMLLDAYGNPFDPVLNISDSLASVPYDARPSVAWDADSGRYMVVWHDERTGWYNVWGQIVGMDGLIIGANISVSQCECDQIYPVAANSPQEGIFMIAWEDFRPGEFNLADSPTPDIWGQLMDPYGMPIVNGVAENMPLYIAPGEQSNISIASDGMDTFMLAFEDHADGQSSITAQMLWAYDASTMSAPDEGCAVSAWHGEAEVGSPTVAANPDEGFTVYWSDTRDEGAIHAQALDYNCIAMDSSAEDNISMGANMAQAEWPAAVLGTNPSRQLLTWQEFDGTSYDIVATFLDPLALINGPAHVGMVTSERTSEINSAVIHNPLVPNYLIAYESTDFSSIYDILIASIADPVYPDITVSDTFYPYNDLFLDFGPSMSGIPSHRTITVHNESPVAALSVDSLQVDGAFGITAESCTMMPVSPDSSCTVSLAFVSDEVGSYSGTLIINSNDPDERDVYVDLQAEATVPRIFLPDGDTTDFGVVPAGSVSERQLSLRNTGTFPLLIDRAVLTGSDVMRISWDTCSGKSLLPMTSCYIAVSFAPDGEGQALSTITIPTSDPDAQIVTLEVKGYGALPDIEGVARQSAVNLGIHTGGSGTYTKPIYLHNTGLAPLYIEDISITGAESLSIEEDQCTGYYTEPSSSCFFVIAFTPGEPGQDIATVLVSTNDPDARTAGFTVEGTSVTVDVPDVIMEALSMDLSTMRAEVGMVYPGYSINETITLTNEGSGALAMGQAQIDGESFYISKDSCSGGSVMPGGICEITVTFNPLSSGEFRAMLHVPSNDPDTGMSELALRAFGQATETAPTAPGLIAPSDGFLIESESVELSWTPSFDLEGNDITYTVILAKNPEFTNPALLVVDAQTDTSSATVPASMLLIGAVLVGAGSSRRRIALLIIVCVLASGLMACGESGGRVISLQGKAASSDTMNYTLMELMPGTYYWKVIATDSTGLQTESEPRSFKIAN